MVSLVRYDTENYSALYADGSLVAEGDEYHLTEYYESLLKVEHHDDTEVFVDPKNNRAFKTLEEIESKLTESENDVNDSKDEWWKSQIREVEERLIQLEAERMADLKNPNPDKHKDVDYILYDNNRDFMALYADGELVKTGDSIQISEYFSNAIVALDRVYSTLHTFDDSGDVAESLQEIADYKATGELPNRSPWI